MENQKNNSEDLGRTIDNLKSDFVKGEEIKGGGMATDGPPALPTGPGPIIAINLPTIPDGQVVAFGGDPLNHPIDLGLMSDSVDGIV